MAAFFIGKGYGEQTFLASDDYKSIAKTREELDYAKGELENAKAKLQNIIDGADKQKTDELLAQILQVFLADLGLQIQNRELILQQAKKLEPSSASADKMMAKSMNEEMRMPVAALAKPSATGYSDHLSEFGSDERRVRQLKKDEWFLLNSNFSQKSLERVTIRDLNRFIALANPVVDDCANFMGRFRGDFRAVDGTRQGSFIFELNDKLEGKISWVFSPHPTVATILNGSCGTKANGILARFFNLSDRLYLQIYPLSENRELAGIMYEKLPAGTIKKIGSFRIRKVI